MQRAACGLTQPLSSGALGGLSTGLSTQLRILPLCDAAAAIAAAANGASALATSCWLPLHTLNQLGD